MFFALDASGSKNADRGVGTDQGAAPAAAAGLGGSHTGHVDAAAVGNCGDLEDVVLAERDAEAASLAVCLVDLDDDARRCCRPS
jgi:hypothetical protein